MFTSVDSELQEYCAQQLNSKDVSNVQISTSKIPLLQSRAISFSASDHSQSKFIHDYGTKTPTISGIWDRVAKKVISHKNSEELATVWDFSEELTIETAINFVTSVLGYNNILITESDVESAHSSYGGKGFGTKVPYFSDENVFVFWVRGHTGQCGTNYNQYSFSFPTKPV